MSQVTLFDCIDADDRVSLIYDDDGSDEDTPKYRPVKSNKPIPTQRKDTEETLLPDYSDEEDEKYDIPVIHMLSAGDTMKSICTRYDIDPALIERSNCFTEITEDVMMKRKFVVIPSKATFHKHKYFNIDQAERWELVKNFCLLFSECCYDRADYYLSKAQYNLAVAVEDYHFDIC